MKRPITWAELILFVLLFFGSAAGVQRLYGFVTDRISVEVHFKESSGTKK